MMHVIANGISVRTQQGSDGAWIVRLDDKALRDLNGFIRRYANETDALKAGMQAAFRMENET